MTLNPQEMAKARRALDMQQAIQKCAESLAQHHIAAANDYEKGSTEHTFHTNSADSIVECCKACMKSDAVADLFKSDTHDGDELEPTKVSAVIPDHVPTPAGGRKVLRTGMHEVRQPTHANTPFEKFTVIEE
jgi:hypothetical protein